MTIREVSILQGVHSFTNILTIVNLGKWVLRNLFASLLDEEIKRDEAHRSTLEVIPPTPATGLVRPGAPTSIAMPEAVDATPMVSPGTMATPRASNGNALIPPTPGFAIGAATPGFAPMTMTLSSTAEEATESVTRTPQPIQQTPTTATVTDPSSDYFSRNSSANNQSEASSESNKVPDTPGTGENNNSHTPLATPTSPTEEKKKGLFGKKFSGMAFPKKLARTSTEVTKTPALAQEEKSDTASHISSSEKEEKVIEDNFFAVVQKIRQEYDEHLESKPGEPLPQGVTPSLPNETPVLNPPPHTTIIIQEDNPESGGLADQYRGEISELGKEADTLEKIAPMWLGELLLKVCIRYPVDMFPLSFFSPFSFSCVADTE